MSLGERIRPFSISNIRGVPFNVEPLSDARTPLAAFFNSLLDHFFEVVDRAYEGILELDLRLPFQESTGSRDIRPSDFWVIGRQRIVRNLAR